jgi:ABC-2 type transport system permease protein
MSRIWAVAKREFLSFFQTPVGYVVLGTYALITGLGFTATFIFYARVSQSPSTWAYEGVPNFEETLLSPFLVFCGTVVMFIGPLISMRLLAEERHRGTIELLLTHPLRDRDIIFGKYLASLGMLLPMMAVISVYMVIVGVFVEIEPAVLVFGIFTVFLVGAAFLSMGLFVSACCRNQITAGTVTFGLFFVFYILGTFAEDLSEENPAPETYGEGMRRVIGFVYNVFRSLGRELPLDMHAKEMAQGIVQPYDIAYYFLFAAFFLFLSFRVLESRKWRA